MATRRMLAASISVSEQVAALRDDFTRLLFTWMIAHADDWGVLPGSPAKVRAIVVPMLDCTNAQVDAALDDLEAHDLIWRYIGDDGIPYMQFRTWERYQQFLHKRTAPKKPLHPACQAASCSAPDTSKNFPEVPGSSRLVRVRGSEVKRSEVKRERETHAHEATLPPAERATADAAPVSLSLSQKPAAAEPEPEQTPRAPSPANEQTTAPDADASALYDAFVQTLGVAPSNGNERRKWRSGLADLLANGITPADAPRLIKQYRAKFGDSVPCHPKAIADNYSQLGASPHVLQQQQNGTTGSVQRHSGPRPAYSAADAAAKRRALAAVGIAVPDFPGATSSDTTP